ncbi:MAG: hypothetical protein NZ811_03310 [Gammaproteobacteria bacterium]|nr:hypothetical protein [Gammaproteobacteria bacterium]
MVRRVKKKDYENLSNQNIEKVLTLLNPSSSAPATTKAITKKEACDILNIAYNTTRLQRIIDDYQERKAYTKKRKIQLRGRPASDQETAEACERYLQGDTISDISKGLFRSASFVRSILERVGVPQRPQNKEEKLGSHYYPDECMSDDYAEGEIAWSASYHSAVEVKSRLSSEYTESKKGLGNTDYESKYGCPVYAVYVKQKIESEDTFFSNVQSGGFSAYVPAYELCKLEHLREYGVRIERL